MFPFGNVYALYGTCLEIGAIFSICNDNTRYTRIFKNAQLLRLLSQSESLYQCYIFLFKHGVNEIFVDTFFDELRETVKKSIDENNLIYSIYEFIRLILPNYWNVLKNYGFIDFFLETTQDRCTELKLEFISCLATYALSVDNAELLEFGQKGGFEAIIEIIYIGYSPYFSVFLKSLIRFLALDNSFVELGNNIQIQDAMESIDTDEQEIQELKQNILSYYVESEE